MCTQHKNIWLLALLSGLLMSLPWLVPGTGLVALFAFVPLLFADSLAQECGMKRFRYVHYSSFVLCTGDRLLRAALRESVFPCFIGHLHQL